MNSKLTAIPSADKPAVDFESAADLEALYRLLDQIQMKNGWAKPTPSIYPAPKQFYVPAHWRYADARAALHAAGRLVGTEWAERRNLIMANPVPGNDYATTRTMVGAYQMVKGGETARSHRHTPNAMRIVLEAAPDTYTIVEGTKIPMMPGDVLLTPNWQYHGHANESGHDSYWIDILDAPLVQFLGPMFFNVHPERVEPAGVIDPHSPMRFAYEEYYPRLLAAAASAPGVRLLELGKDALPTMDRTAIHLEEGTTWDLVRSTANQILAVVSGSGSARIDERTLEWRRGDMLVIPSWNRAVVEATEQAVLVRVTDEPVMRAMNWLRQAPE